MGGLEGYMSLYPTLQLVHLFSLRDITDVATQAAKLCPQLRLFCILSSPELAEGCIEGCEKKCSLDKAKKSLD